jgi:hypothetical protein
LLASGCAELLCSCARLLARLEVNRCKLAAPVNFNVKRDAVAFIEASHTRAFHRRDMDERVGLPVIALNKAEALHRVEEFDRASRLFACQLTLRCAAAITAAAKSATITAAAIRTIAAITRRPAIRYRHRFAIDLEIGRRDFAAAIYQRIAKRLTIGEASEASLLDRRNVHEHIFAATVLNDEAKTLLAIEKLDDTSAFANDLGWHHRRTRAAGAESAPATTTAKPVTAAAEAISASAETVTAAAGKILFAETVSFVSAAPAALAATPFIETHALSDFLKYSPKSYPKTLAPDDGHKVQSAKP